MRLRTLGLGDGFVRNDKRKDEAGERLFFILLFLDEKKQKSSDYIIC